MIVKLHHLLKYIKVTFDIVKACIFILIIAKKNTFKNKNWVRLFLKILILSFNDRALNLLIYPFFKRC